MNSSEALTKPQSSSTHKTRTLSPLLRVGISTLIILGLWQLVVWRFEMPSFILPAPVEVFNKLIERYDVLLKHTWGNSARDPSGAATWLIDGIVLRTSNVVIRTA